MEDIHTKNTKKTPKATGRKKRFVHNTGRKYSGPAVLEAPDTRRAKGNTLPKRKSGQQTIHGGDEKQVKLVVDFGLNTRRRAAMCRQRELLHPIEDARLPNKRAKTAAVFDTTAVHLFHHETTAVLPF